MTRHTFGASDTNIFDNLSSGALSALGGKENVKAAFDLARALTPQPEPVDPALLSFLFFSKMAEESSKPGSTALGAAGAAATSPASYLMQRRKAEREAEASVPTTALSLAKMLKPDTTTAGSTSFDTYQLKKDIAGYGQTGDLITLSGSVAASLLKADPASIIQYSEKTATDAKAPKPYFIAEENLSKLNTLLGTTFTRSDLGNVLLTPEQFSKGQSLLGQEVKKSAQGSQYERIQSNVNRIGLLLADPNTATGVSDSDKLTYLQDYQKLISGGEYTVIENGKEITKFLPGIDLTNSILPIPEGLDMEKIIREKSQKFDQNQTRAAGFGSRMLYNEGILRNVLSEGYALKIEDVAQIRLMEKLGLGTIGVDDQARQFHVAAQNWVAAQLREESGAAIGPKEYTDALLQYFPTVGDDADTRANKRALREQSTRAMIRTAGDAFGVIFDNATPYLTYTSDDETYDILNPQGYANELLAKNQLGIDLYFKDTIKSKTTEQLRKMLAHPNAAGIYTSEQLSLIGEELEFRINEE